jgi:hypothetical protein
VPRVPKTKEGEKVRPSTFFENGYNSTSVNGYHIFISGSARVTVVGYNNYVYATDNAVVIVDGSSNYCKFMDNSSGKVINNAGANYGEGIVQLYENAVGTANSGGTIAYDTSVAFLTGSAKGTLLERSRGILNERALGEFNEKSRGLLYGKSQGVFKGDSTGEGHEDSILWKASENCVLSGNVLPLSEESVEDEIRDAILWLSGQENFGLPLMKKLELTQLQCNEQDSLMDELKERGLL